MGRAGVRRVTALAIGALAFALLACGDNLEVAAPDAGFAEASHASPPQVQANGGPVLASPEIVPIFFAGDGDMQGQIESFLTALAPSSYWTTIASEYGVGAPTVMPSIVSNDAPPTTDDELQEWLEAHLEPPIIVPPLAFSPYGWPRPNANTVYVVFLPSGITLTAGSEVSCVAFGGYHSETTRSGIVYALLPRCATNDAPIDELTPPTSHELIEAATDPHPGTAPGYVGVDDADLVWDYTPGSEVGDMCEYVETAFQRLVGNYVVQRIWSNASAAAGHDPCVPVLASPYIAAAPALDNVMFDYGDGIATTRGVQISNGTSVTIELDLFSDAPTADWAVGMDDVASVVQMQPAELALSLDKTTGNNGDKLALTIKRLKVGQGGGSEFVVTSKVDGSVIALWWGLATN